MAAITPHIVVNDAARAAGWYADALGAGEQSRITLAERKARASRVRLQ